VPLGLSGFVEQHNTRPRRERSRKPFLGQSPVRRLKSHEPRDAAGALHERQIAIVERLKQHDLIARRDRRQQRAGDRLGRA
jgi:hypothetical protein